MLCKTQTTYCCYDVTSIKLKFSRKGITEHVLEHSGHGPLEKHRRVLSEKLNVTSSERGFPTNNHTVATYEQDKESFSYFYPKQKIKSGGIHPQSPNL